MRYPSPCSITGDATVARDDDGRVWFEHADPEIDHWFAAGRQE